MAKSLNSIKPFLGEWASSNRTTKREEVVIARLRKGCTLPTHILIFISHSFPRQCPRCNVTLIVNHISIHCVRYQEVRRSLTAFCVARRLPVTQVMDDPDVIDGQMFFLTETNLIRELWLTHVSVIHYVQMQHVCSCYCTCFANNILEWISVWRIFV